MDGKPDPAPRASRAVNGLRVLLGALGVLAIGYGALRILTDAKDTKPIALAKWLIGSLLVHDLLIAPVVIGIGWLLARFVPARARTFVQAGLVTGGLVGALGVLLIWRQGKTSARSLALLQQNYTANLLLLLAFIAAVTAGCYLISASLTNRRNARPPADH
jgi:hypothetical protein